MELTVIAMIASLCMGLGAVLLFIFAIQRRWFHNLEEAKYQVFWSDIEPLVNDSRKDKDGSQS